ncbi:MAG: WD40 repeat domain-containing protein [Cyanophyceae cyanobacterium]
MTSQSLLQLEHRAVLQDYVRAIAWSGNGELAACSAAGEVALWHSGQLSLLQSAELTVSCLDFSSDGQFLAAGGQNGRVNIWQRSAGMTLLKTLDYGSVWIDRLAWSPVENQLAIGVGRQVQVWSAREQESVATFDFAASSILGLAWHPQGKRLAVSGHRYVKVWDFNEEFLLEVPGASLCPAWSVDGKYLASGNFDRTVSVLEWGNPPPWLMQGFPKKVHSIAWSDLVTQQQVPLLAAACTQGIAVWYRSGSDWQNYTLTQHQGFVQAIAFQPGTFLLASAGSEGCIYLWQQAQTLVQTLKGQTGFSCLAWNSTGDTLAAGGQQGELLIWSKTTNLANF